jgi:cation diffusion facilitator family transporter
MGINRKIRYQWITVLVGLLLLGSKFLAFYLTGSIIILSDALESLVNITTGVFGLYSLYLAAKPRDKDHPYGHGKIEFISAGLEGSLITLAGIGITIKSVYNLLNPAPLEQLDIGIAIVAAAGLVNYGLGFFAERIGRKNNSLTLVASGKHLKTDAYTTVAMLVGLGLILLTGKIWLDSVIALLLAAIIIYTGVRLIRTSVGGIMDEADFSLISEVVRHLEANREDPWIDIHNLRIIKYGDAIHIDCHVTLPWYYNVEQGHNEIEKIEALIMEKLSSNIESFIHIDPCVARSCAICRIANCKVRRTAFHQKIDWSLENVMRNKKHSEV